MATEPQAATYRIAPSILSADFARLGEEVRNVIAAGADWMLAQAFAQVAGSAVFGQPNYRAVIHAMRDRLPRVAAEVA